MIAPTMNKLVLVAAMLMPMVQAAQNQLSVAELINQFQQGPVQHTTQHNKVKTKIIKGPKIDGKRNVYFIKKCIGSGKENFAYMVRDGPFPQDNIRCLKVGACEAGWAYERDFLLKIADSPAAPYFPRIHDAFEWKDRNSGGALKYVLVMDFLEGFKPLKDFVGSYGSDGVPPALAQQVLTEIVRVTAVMHAVTVTTTKTKKYFSRRLKKRCTKTTTTTKPLCHADYHEENIMVKVDHGQVQVRVIDPHKVSQMKPHNNYTDMFFVAKHAVMLSCQGGPRTIKHAMQDAVINELPTGVQRYIHEALGASNFTEAAIIEGVKVEELEFGGMSNKQGQFWDNVSEIGRPVVRSTHIKSADYMHKYLSQNFGIFNR